MGYDYWLNALKGEFGPIHEDDPQPGFYRKRTGRAAGYAPVAIWEMDGKIVAMVGEQVEDAAAIWSYVADKPVTEEQYRDRVATGKWWDEDDSVTASLAVPGAGHNNPPDVDTIKDQIEAALQAVATYAEIGDDTAAAKAQSARSRLLELSREADKKRELEKKPHFEAGKAVDAAWQPLVKSAKEGADAIAKALSAHETAKAREAARLAAIAAEVQRKALEEAQARAPIGVTVEPEPAPTPPPVAAVPIKGAYGRGASVRVVKTATVADQDAAYAYLRNQPDMVALIQKLAQKAVDAGFTVPGVTVEEARKVV